MCLRRSRREGPSTRRRAGFPVEVTAATVQRGDIIQLGGQAYRVRDLLQLPQGAKQLVFESGELLAIHTRTRLIALRLLRRR